MPAVSADAEDCGGGRFRGKRRSRHWVQKSNRFSRAPGSQKEEFRIVSRRPKLAQNKIAGRGTRFHCSRMREQTSTSGPLTYFFRGKTEPANLPLTFLKNKEEKFVYSPTITEWPFFTGRLVLIRQKHNLYAPAEDHPSLPDESLHTCRLCLPTRLALLRKYAYDPLK